MNQEKERHGIQKTGTQPTKEVKKNPRKITDRIVNTYDDIEKRFSGL